MMDQRNQVSHVHGARPRVVWWIIACAVIAAILIGRGFSGGPAAIAADPNQDATSTRTAELIELNDMRTKIALPVLCTPVSTPTLTPTQEPTATATIVPAIPAGQEVLYNDVFAITVLNIENVGSTGDLAPSGVFLRVNLTFRNLTGSFQAPPHNDWRLVDASGDGYGVDFTASLGIVGPYWGSSIGGHETATLGVVFDVSTDAGSTFVLESVAEPGFRIELSIVSRG